MLFQVKSEKTKPDKVKHDILISPPNRLVLLLFSSLDPDPLEPQHFSSLDPHHFSSLDPLHFSSLDPQHFSSLDPQHFSSLDPQHFNSLDQQHYSSLNPQHFSSLDSQNFSSKGSGLKRPNFNQSIKMFALNAFFQPIAMRRSWFIKFKCFSLKRFFVSNYQRLKKYLFWNRDLFLPGGFRIRILSGGFRIRIHVKMKLIPRLQGCESF